MNRLLLALIKIYPGMMYNLCKKIIAGIGVLRPPRAFVPFETLLNDV